MWVQSGGWCGIGRRLIAEEARRHVLPQLATRRLVRVARHGGRTYMNAPASGRECGLSRGTQSTVRLRGVRPLSESSGIQRRYGEIWGDMGRYGEIDRSASAAEYGGARPKTAESVSSRALVGAQARVFRFWGTRYGEICGDVGRSSASRPLCVQQSGPGAIAGDSAPRVGSPSQSCAACVRVCGPVLGATRCVALTGCF